MKRLRQVFLAGIVLFLLFFVILVCNQLVSLYRNLATVSLVLAQLVTFVAGLLLLVLLLMPLIAFLRYPKVKELPLVPNSEEYAEYLDARLRQLKRNRFLVSVDYDFAGETPEEQVHGAYFVLKKKGDMLLKKDAKAIFLTTAVSQNGVLDGLCVLFSLLRMVYGLTVLYENRPGLVRLLYLYGQIASVVLIARSLEDMDLIEEQIEPLMTSLVGGSVLSIVPGATGIVTLIVNSIVEGSVNALLTLRVGIIAQRYLSATVAFDKKGLRRGASLEASGQLGEIIKDNGVFVAKSFVKAAKGATVERWRLS